MSKKKIKEEYYTAIIGDLVGSRTIENRPALQRKLVDTLSEVNHLFAESLTSSLIITTGDEFQALACDLNSAYRIAKEIELRLHPFAVRFGIGYGSIEVFPKNGEFAIGFDGEAFWRAREAIEDSKFSKVSLSFRTGTEFDEILKSVQMAIEWIVRKRTDFQNRVVSLCRKDYTQAKIAIELKTHQPNISRALKDAGYYEELGLYIVISNILILINTNIHVINNLKIYHPNIST